MRLLTAGETPPWIALNPGADSPFLLLGDHASRTVPLWLMNLRLSDAELSRHIGWDIGGLDSAIELSKALDAPLVSSGYSRLVMDMNRPPHRADLFPVLTPLAIDPAHPFPFIPNLGFTLAFEMVRLGTAQTLTALVRVPSNIDRFVTLPNNLTTENRVEVVTVDTMINLFISKMFPGYEVSGSGSFRIIRDSRLEVAARVPELELAQVQPGQRAVVRHGDRVIQAEVRLVAPVVAADTRLGTVHVALPADSGLRPGMFARAEITGASREVVMVPASALNSSSMASSLSFSYRLSSDSAARVRAIVIRCLSI